MEALIWLVSLMVNVAQPSERRATAIQHWVDHDDKIIYVSPANELRVDFIPMPNSQNLGGVVNVKLGYSIESAQKQTQALKEQYPNYKLSKVIIASIEPVRVTIPTLNLDTTTMPMNGPEGPTFGFQFLKVEKSQIEEVKKAIESGNFVTMSGRVKVYVPETKIQERVELRESVCAELFQKSNALADVVENTNQLFRELDQMHLEYESTRDSLKKAVTDNCVDFRIDAPIKDYAELLDKKIEQKNPVDRLRGETRNKSTSSKTVNLDYFVVHNLESKKGAK
jgi:hypothetical protein